MREILIWAAVWVLALFASWWMVVGATQFMEWWRMMRGPMQDGMADAWRKALRREEET